jgi:hypothetical protein
MPKINSGSIGIKILFNTKLVIFVIMETKFSIGTKLFLYPIKPSVNPIYNACSFVINFGRGMLNKFNKEGPVFILSNTASTFIKKVARFNDPNTCKKFELQINKIIAGKNKIE